MGKIEGANVEEATAFVAENIGKIGDAVRGVLTDADGRAKAPFILLLPIASGVQMVSNISSANAIDVMRAAVMGMQLDDLREFIAEAVPVILAVVEASDEDGTPPQVH